MVLRDRNHPSIIIWSLCNEGGCMQGNPDGGYVGAAFKKAIFDVDTSRPVTANSEDTEGDTLTKVMDVNSFSYNYGEYDAFHYEYAWPFAVLTCFSRAVVSTKPTARCRPLAVHVSVSAPPVDVHVLLLALGPWPCWRVPSVPTSAPSRHVCRVRA